MRKKLCIFVIVESGSATHGAFSLKQFIPYGWVTIIISMQMLNPVTINRNQGGCFLRKNAEKLKTKSSY